MTLKYIQKLKFHFKKPIWKVIFKYIYIYSYFILGDPSFITKDIAEKCHIVAHLIIDLRPEIDCYLVNFSNFLKILINILKVSDRGVENAALVYNQKYCGENPIRRIFYKHEDLIELHLSILHGIRYFYF